MCDVRIAEDGERILDAKRMIGVFAAAIMMRGVAVVTYMVFLALLHNHTHLVMMMVMRHEGGYQDRQQQYRHDYVAKIYTYFLSRKRSKGFLLANIENIFVILVAIV